MLLVPAWVAPKFLSIQILPVAGLVTSTITVGPEAQNTEGWAALTKKVNVQVCPPMFRAKFAVPLEDGVPVIV